MKKIKKGRDTKKSGIVYTNATTQKCSGDFQKPIIAIQKKKWKSTARL
jgi:hypothetical protein